MTTFLALAVVLEAILIWGVYSRLYEQNREIWNLKYPDMADKETILASYLGSAEDE